MAWFDKKLTTRRGYEFNPTEHDKARTEQWEQSQDPTFSLDTGFQKMREGKGIRKGRTEPRQFPTDQRVTHTTQDIGRLQRGPQTHTRGIRVIDPVQDFLNNWEMQEHLFDTAPNDDKRYHICSQCDTKLEEGRSLGINILDSSLCQKCSSEGLDRGWEQGHDF